MKDFESFRESRGEQKKPNSGRPETWGPVPGPEQPVRDFLLNMASFKDSQLCLSCPDVTILEGDIDQPSLGQSPPPDHSATARIGMDPDFVGTKNSYNLQSLP